TFQVYIINEPGVDCYGPDVQVMYNPETCGAGPDNLPTGDLGIWDNTQSTGEACLAAKMNAEVSYVGSYVDTAMRMLYSMMCAYKVKNDMTEIPNGATASLVDDINARVSGASMTTSTFTYNDGTLTASMVGTVGVNTVNVSVTNRTTKDGETYTYTGIVYGSMLLQDGSKDVFSTLYNITETTTTGTYKYEVKKRRAGTSEPDSALFASDHSVIYWSSSGGYPAPTSGGTYSKLQLDETGSGTAYYAWQAGAGDPNTRVFQAQTTGTSGYGYFGYGPNLYDGNSGGNLGSITGMICYWTGPGSTQTMHSGVVQAQALTKTSGLYVPSANYTRYMLSNSCDYTTCPGNNFQYRKGTTGAWTTYATNFTNDLVTYSTAVAGGVSGLGPISSITLEGL
ncbi:MAG: hypothetical protein V1647_03710, partial [Pseudomonadota bacterium]